MAAAGCGTGVGGGMQFKKEMYMCVSTLADKTALHTKRAEQLGSPAAPCEVHADRGKLWPKSQTSNTCMHENQVHQQPGKTVHPPCTPFGCRVWVGDACVRTQLRYGAWTRTFVRMAEGICAHAQTCAQPSEGHRPCAGHHHRPCVTPGPLAHTLQRYRICAWEPRNTPGFKQLYPARSSGQRGPCSPPHPCAPPTLCRKHGKPLACRSSWHCSGTARLCAHVRT